MCKENEKMMPGMTLANIARSCGGTYVGDESRKQACIAGAVTDSRQVGKDFLFIPIKGARVDGHDFIPAVFAEGALAVLSEHTLENPQGPYILVDSTTEAMKKIAAFYRTQLSCKVVGITGSVGKTSTKEMIASVLSEKYEVLKTEGNFNNEIGLPLTIFKIRAHHEVAVLEMGISDFGEMHRLAAMAQPDICVITNIGLCHLENLGTRDGILQAKTECFDHMQPDGTVILNGDDDKLCTKQEVGGKPSIFYGFGEVSGTKNSIYATDVKNLGLNGMQAQIHTPQGIFTAQIPIPGEHNVYNALAGTAVGLTLGLTTEQIAQGIAAAQTIAGRTNLIHTGGMTVIDDCYNANPVSMKASIDVLAHTSGRRIAVLGDMGELGTEERALHYGVGAAVGQSGIDTLFCAGTLAEEYAKAAAEVNMGCEVLYFQKREEMTKALCDYVKEGDTILVKASHFMEFPKVVEALSALAK
jgi:UDP-N-acetylmuramoyl-tripeptide--D-alanyl-D-alanine ligase